MVGKSIVGERGPLVAAAIRKGAPTLSAAARLAGVHPSTVSEWMNRGLGLDDREQTDEMVEFVRLVETARAQFVQDRLDAIKAAGEDPKHWTANAWLLERMFPEEFARRQVIHKGEGLVKQYAFAEPDIPEPDMPLEVEAEVTNGHANGHANGNGHTNGNGHAQLPPAEGGNGCADSSE